MKRATFNQMARPTTGAAEPMPVGRFVNRAGRSLNVLLEVQDERDDGIRVALDAFGAVSGSGFTSGTVH